MSQVEVGTASVAGAIVLGVGSLALLAVAGVAVIGAAGAVSLVTKGAGKAREIEKKRKAELEEARRKALLHAIEALRVESEERIRALHDEAAKRSLKKALEETMRSCKAEIGEGQSADLLFREFRRKILDAELEEKFANVCYTDFEALRLRIEKNLSPAFRSEWDGIQRSWSEVHSLSYERRIASMPLLLERANQLVQRMNDFRDISIDGLSEEVVTLCCHPKEAIRQDDKIESLRAAIADFASRISFFERDEAEKQQHLLKEAETCTSVARLSLIRNMFMTNYNKIKEARTLTESFKQEIRELLPLLEKARNADSLIVRMEDLLEERDIPRGEYSGLYMEAQQLLAEQMESIVDTAVAQKVEGILEGMGYSLVAEDFSETGDSFTGLRPGEVRHLETPYNGYRVRVRVEEGKVSTRLVRVVANEKETLAGGEYQRQKDEETGKQWCRDLKVFHDSLEKEGVFIASLLHKEPGEEPVEVMVDGRSAPAKHTADAGAAMRSRP